MNEICFTLLRDVARRQYNDANCKYDDNEYIYHIDMVVENIERFELVFKSHNDYLITRIAGLYHDIIEDTKQSYNDVSLVIGKDAADIVLAVTDVSAENRLMKHLLTMGKTVMNYRAIILKMCDICANSTYSKAHGSSMYKKYVEEYQYRKPIFKKALTWYGHELNQDMLNQLWDELDYVHSVNQKI